ncbi:hypothetical protein [Spirulina sp. 06S082]|uniref:hypothetical protein n=1 Tax=Spirulina sp. 06S082 TaxID=3110248 RepID=UPI002B202202|nr:hypothetical protein [Spirulina sp. 06S082]MEA5472242.1 hypothetical protein [Spirulina sp. 06S082]
MTTNSTFKEEEKFCSKILKTRRIKNKIVVLCEGDRAYLNIRTPQQIRQLENIPDANFWTACIPQWWREKRPVFLPCGGRNDVLRVRKTLLEMHDRDPENSYLSPDKLFVLVDRDLENTDIELSYNNIETLCQEMYANIDTMYKAISESKIIVTGWMHKEAYFLEPDLAELFAAHENKPMYNGEKLSLEKIYHDMNQDIIDPQDDDEKIAEEKRKEIEEMQNNFTTISERVKRTCQNLDGTFVDKKEFCDRWKIAFTNPRCNPTQKRELIEVILKIRKAKLYWKNKIHLSSSYSNLTETELKNNLSLEIANFYSDRCQKLDQSHPYHIPYWMRCLIRFC